MVKADLEGGDAIAYKGLDISVPVPGSLYTDDGGAYARHH
jgi:hypothetical protein